MNELDKALQEIAQIRHQIARGAEFAGYGPVTMATTGVIAGLAALAQIAFVPEPTTDFGLWLALWTATAAASAGLIGVEAITRSRRVHSGLAEEMIFASVEQFVPMVMSGALLTVVLLRFAPDVLWMLPGLWQVLFALGLFASVRFLPRPIVAVGVWYLGSGLACLALAQDVAAFAPWAMGVPFTVGQLLIAAVLWQAQRRGYGADDGNA